MDTEKTNKFLEENYDSVFVHHLSEYIKIPNLTPAFDPEYMTNGLLEQAIDYVVKFAEDLQIEGLKTHIKREEGRVPMVLFELPGASSSNVMIYGHLDKQPHMEGWIEGTGPTTPTIIGDKLYGRGSSDDGYVPFAVLLAIKNAIAQGAELPRIVLVLETEEESGSHDLVPLLEASADIIGTPDYCICLDSGALDYTSLWLTSTLRGMVAFNLKVSVTELACHSGISGGAIPESFRIANSLLDRIEDPETRRIELLEREIPDSYKEEAKHVSSISGEDTVKAFKFLAGVKAINEDDLAELYLNTTWRPALAVTGADNLPPTSKAGNVVRDSTTLRVSIRLPPGVESTEALEKLREVITKDVPNDAKVELLEPSTGDGWQMKDLSEKTTKVLNDASDAFFTKPCGTLPFSLLAYKYKALLNFDFVYKYGIGGSIPFLKVLGDKYPSTEILALGVLGPDIESSTNSTHFDKSNIKEMMKYNLNNLFKDPNIFEWPPIVYEELQNNGWNHLTEAVVGSKFSSIRPFFNDRKIKHQQRLSLLKSQRREGIRLKNGVIDNKLMLNSCFDKVLSSPTKQKKRKAKRRSHKFDPSSLETAKARQNRFSIAALKEKFMEQIAANRLNSSKRSSVSTICNSKRSTRRGLSCKISTNSYYPNLRNSLHIYTQSGHNNSYLLTEKKQGNIGVDNKGEDTTCNSSDKNYKKSTSGYFRPTRLKFLTNESVKLYKKEFIKSLRKAPTQKTEKSEAFQIGHQFGQFHTSKICCKPKLNFSTYYGSFATSKKRVLSSVSQ